MSRQGRHELHGQRRVVRHTYAALGERFTQLVYHFHCHHLVLCRAPSWCHTRRVELDLLLKHTSCHWVSTMKHSLTHNFSVARVTLLSTILSITSPIFSPRIAPNDHICMWNALPATTPGIAHSSK